MSNKILICPVLVLFCFPYLCAQTGANLDSVYNSITQLADDARVERINRDFYQLYSLDFSLADRLATEALAICRREGWEKDAAITLKNLGVVKFLQGNYEAALAAYQESLEIFSRLRDESGQCSVCNELGVFFSKRQEYDRSIAFLNRATEHCKTVKDSVGWSNAMDNRGVVFMRMGKLGEAEELFREVIELRNEIGDTLGLSYVYNNLSAVAAELKNVEQAARYLQLSTDLREKLNDRQGVAININNMGELLLTAGKASQAIPFFRQSLEKSQALKFTDLERHTMEMLARAYEETEDYAEALNWKNRSYRLKDSLFNLERSAQIAEMQEKYEAEKKEKELRQQQLVLRKRNMALVVSSIAVLSLATILILVIRQYRARQRQLRKEARLRESLLVRENENHIQQERLRISRDLHDHLGAELSLIRSGIARQLYHPEQLVDRAALESVSQNTQKAMEELRETIWAIRGDSGTIQDLAEKMLDFSGRFEDITVDLDLEGPLAEIPLSPGQSLTLYRIFQEAIHNAAKYAPGAHLKLQFARESHQLRITFSDNGPGFDTTKPATGYGLGNMKHRAGEIGADFDLKSGPEGTTIFLEMPLSS